MPEAVPLNASTTVANVLAYLRDIDGYHLLVELDQGKVYGFASPRDGYAVHDCGTEKDEAILIAASHGYLPVPEPRAFLGLDKLAEWAANQPGLH